MGRTDKIPDLHFYCDASSSRNHSYMAAGGVAVTPERASEINAQVAALRHSVGIQSRFHWSEYRGGARSEAYHALVDLFFDLINEGKLHAHFILCRFGEFNHKIKGPGNPDRSVNRMYYQLFLHRVCSFYGGKTAIHVFPDRGNDSSEVVSFRGAICAAAYKEYRTKPNCLRSIRPTSSYHSHMIQMVDVVIGAVAAHREKRHLSSHKHRLMTHVIARSGHHDWSVDTPLGERRLTVWNFLHQR